MKCVQRGFLIIAERLQLRGVEGAPRQVSPEPKEQRERERERERERGEERWAGERRRRSREQVREL